MKKLNAILLLLAMLTPMFLFGCKDDSENRNQSSNSETETNPEFDEYGRAWVDSALPSGLRFEDENFVVLCFDYNKKHLYGGEDGSGDVVNNALYERNLQMEEKLGINFGFYPSTCANEDDLYRIIDSTQYTGDNSYQVVYTIDSQLTPLALKGYWYNMKDIPYVSFDKPWWNAEYIEENTVLGQIYTVMGEASSCAPLGMTCTFFNHNLCENNGISVEELYAHVDNGTWTLDVFTQYVKDFYVDNGNQVRDSDDTFGLVAWDDASPFEGWIYSFDVDLTDRDSEGLPTLTLYNAHTEDVYGKLISLYHTNEGVYFHPEKAFDAIGCFANDHAVFMCTTLSMTNHLRNMTSTYGILPLPKYDGSQKTYKTNVEGLSFAIPSFYDDTSLHGAVLEYMSELTWRDVRPAVYEVALKSKYFADQASGRMFDYVLAGATRDLGESYSEVISRGKSSDASYSYLFRNNLRDAKPTLSTAYNRYKIVFTRGLNDLIDGLKKNQDA